MVAKLVMDVRTACRSVTDTGARCREMVDGYGCCHRHPSGKLAGSPDKVLLKVRVNRRKFVSLQEAGIDVKVRNEAALEKKHVAEAEQHRRQAYALRSSKADSGVQVFGSDGARDVAIDNVWNQLEYVGYTVTNAHLYQQERDKKSGMGMLVVEFTLAGNESQSLVDLADCAAAFDDASYGYVHVFVNPPKENQGVVHTVNASHRQPDLSPRARLVWDGGHWALGTV